MRHFSTVTLLLISEVIACTLKSLSPGCVIGAGVFKRRQNSSCRRDRQKQYYQTLRCLQQDTASNPHFAGIRDTKSASMYSQNGFATIGAEAAFATLASYPPGFVSNSHSSWMSLSLLAYDRSALPQSVRQMRGHIIWVRPNRLKIDEGRCTSRIHPGCTIGQRGACIQMGSIAPRLL